MTPGTAGGVCILQSLFSISTIETAEQHPTLTLKTLLFTTRYFFLQLTNSHQNHKKRITLLKRAEFNDALKTISPSETTSTTQNQRVTMWHHQIEHLFFVLSKDETAQRFFLCLLRLGNHRHRNRP